MPNPNFSNKCAVESHIFNFSIPLGMVGYSLQDESIDVSESVSQTYHYLELGSVVWIQEERKQLNASSCTL